MAEILRVEFCAWGFVYVNEAVWGCVGSFVVTSALVYEEGFVVLKYAGRFGLITSCSNLFGKYGLNV